MEKYTKSENAEYETQIAEAMELVNGKGAAEKYGRGTKDASGASNVIYRVFPKQPLTKSKKKDSINWRVLLTAAVIAVSLGTVTVSVSNIVKSGNEKLENHVLCIGDLEERRAFVDWAKQAGLPICQETFDLWYSIPHDDKTEGSSR